jgi:radical SAM superfamily enzyme YgiQ (UPF0313 family)
MKTVAVLLDIPDVPYRASAANVAIDEELSREDERWERRYGLKNQDRSRRKSYSSGLLCLAPALLAQGYRVSYLDYRRIQDANAQCVLSAASVILITSISPFFPIFVELVRILRNAGITVPFIIGGFGPTYEPQKFLAECPAGSVAALGEGESSVLGAIEYLSDQALRPGLAVVTGKHLHVGPERPLLDASQIPMPEYCLLGQLNDYRVNVSTIRGCPGACLFCSGTGFWPSIRCRPVDSVIGELDYLNSVLPPGELVHFCDNVVTFDRARFLELAQAMAARRYAINFSCDIRSDSIDAQTAWALEQAGFRRICVGVEDCDDGILAAGRKGLRFAQSRRALELLRQHTTAYLTAYWMVGLPGTTQATVAHNLATIGSLVRGRWVDQIALSLFKPYPGCKGLEGIVTLERTWNDYLTDMEYPLYCLPSASASDLAQMVLAYKRAVLDAYRARF